MEKELFRFVGVDGDMAVVEWGFRADERMSIGLDTLRGRRFNLRARGDDHSETDKAIAALEAATGPMFGDTRWNKAADCVETYIGAGIWKSGPSFTAEASPPLIRGDLTDEDIARINAAGPGGYTPTPIYRIDGTGGWRLQPDGQWVAFDHQPSLSAADQARMDAEFNQPMPVQPRYREKRVNILGFPLIIDEDLARDVVVLKDAETGATCATITGIDLLCGVKLALGTPAKDTNAIQPEPADSRADRLAAAFAAPAHGEYGKGWGE